MTVDELLARESIRDCMARYTMAGDRLKVDAFVAVFTDDATLETAGVSGDDAFSYRGREAIRAWMGRWLDNAGSSQPSHQASFVRHHLSTSQIDLVDARNATARTYWTAYTDMGADHCGHYLDTFRKVGDQWLIAHRVIRLDWRSPDSLMFTAITRTR